jgi:hypothetical protein
MRSMLARLRRTKGAIEGVRERRMLGLKDAWSGEEVCVNAMPPVLSTMKRSGWLMISCNKGWNMGRASARRRMEVRRMEVGSECRIIWIGALGLGALEGQGTFELSTASRWRRWRVVVMVARKVYTMSRSSVGRFRKANVAGVSDGWGESVPVCDGVDENGEGVFVSEGVSDMFELEAL